VLPPCWSRALRVPAGRAAELDERWSFVGAKAPARWRGQAIDHPSGRVVASGGGTRKAAVFRKRKALLAPCGITRYYTDTAGGSQPPLPPEPPPVGKLTRQKRERKPLPLRTRLKRFARKTLGFSRSRVLHDLLSGFYINRVELGWAG
jgi:insertion element IS1 protein InsB